MEEVDVRMGACERWWVVCGTGPMNLSLTGDALQSASMPQLKTPD